MIDKVIKGITALLGVCLLIYIGMTYVKNMPQATIESKEVLAEINAKVLNKAFQENEKKAEKTYLGKALVIKGAIGEKYEDQTGAPVIVFNSKGGDPIALVTLETSQKEAINSYNEGQFIKIKALCTGMLMEVTLNKGIIVD